MQQEEHRNERNTSAAGLQTLSRC